MTAHSGRPTETLRPPIKVAALVLAFVHALYTVPAAAKEQAYRVRYHYRLTNKTDQPVTDVQVHIPVPQSCPYQEIRSFEITLPDPTYKKKDVVDQFDQKICQIVVPRIEPRGSIEVGFDCNVVLHPDHRIELARDRIGRLEDIPESIRTTYTANIRGVYDLNSARIRETAARLVKPHENLLDRVMALHDFVAQMKYTRDNRWDSASTVLERMTGSCSEFSFLFCALCRAAGIPTRFAGGSYCRHGKGKPWPAVDMVYHRWAEVYLLPYGWVPFDVTRNRGNPPKRTYVGAVPRDVLILTRGPCGSRYLGTQYIGSNTKYLSLKRERSFVWSPR